MNDYKELIENLDRIIFREKTAIYGVGEINIRSMATELKQVIEQLVKERDAAVKDLKNIRACRFCKNEQVLIDNEPCNSCLLFQEGTHINNFEWRGVQEDNDEID